LSEYIPKKAIVTGGSRGIGSAIVKEFVKKDENGNHFSDVVFIYNNSKENADKLVNELAGEGIKLFALKADVSSFEETEVAVKKASELLGGVDFLVNNAGITKDNLLLRMTKEDFESVIDVNLNSVFNYTKSVLRIMLKQRFGRIVNLTSVVGVTGNAGQANYAASKAGVIGFTKSIAKEIASRNISVNAVAPGFIQTDMTGQLNEDQQKSLLQNIPMNRMGQPEDIAKVVKFLCSENAGYITGQVLNVDGGMVM